MNWHTLDIKNVLVELGADPSAGLTDKDVLERRLKYGTNELKERSKRSILSLFIEQLSDFLILILLVAAIVSALLGEFKDATVIFAIVIMNAVLSVVQEERASKAIDALKKMSSPKVMVKRAGEIKRLSVKELVPGDIIFLETGGVVGADARIIESINLRTSESALTGESAPVDKTIDAISKKDTPIADMKNMIFAGTTVVYGRGHAVVTSTGMNSQIGHIADMVQSEVDESTPLEEKLTIFGKWLGIAALFVCFLVFLFAFLEGGDLFTDFLTAVSLAVAAIPEGLPAVTTISLALGAYRMAKRGAIIRKLPAVETLGCVSVICTDKTGTLTQNKMTVNTIFIDGRTISVSGLGYEPTGEFKEAGNTLEVHNYIKLTELLRAAALCNDSLLEHFKETNSYGVLGDPTEGALVVLAQKAGLTKEQLDIEFQRVNEIPFDSNRKLMTTVHKLRSGGHIIYVKGAPEEVLNKCIKIDVESMKKKNAEMAAKGLRTLGVAFKIVQNNVDINSAESDLEFLGIIGMIDLARPEVKQAVAQCIQAGITPVMITGDHKLTAEAIAKELGIEKVYSRVSPEDKLRIVAEFKEKGEVVAVTGDGVNDAPALKKADIGIAMGITGTDVAKEASDMVLADDNFATIVHAIEEGRGIFENIRKFVWYLLSANVGEILTMFFSIILRLPLPLLPIQILWVNLATDGLPALALSVEPIEKDLMLRKPRKKNEGIIDTNMIISMIEIGVIMGVVTIILFLMGMQVSIEKGRTMAFSSLALLEMYHVFNCKSEKKSVFEIGVFSNPYLIFAVLSTVALQFLLIFTPMFQRIFDTVSLTGVELVWLFGLTSTPLVYMELRKLAVRLITCRRCP